MHGNKSTFEVLRENFLGSESMLTAVGQDSHPGRVARTGAQSQTLFTNIISEKKNLGKKLDTWYRQHNNALIQMNRDQRPLYVSLMKTATKRKKLEVERERRRQERARQLARELPPIVERPSAGHSEVLDLTKKTESSQSNDGKVQPAALVVEGHIGQDFIGINNSSENPERLSGSPFLDVPDSFNPGRRKSSVQEETASLLSSLQKTFDIQPSGGEDVLKKDDSKLHREDKERPSDTKKKKRTRNKKERTSKKTLPPVDDRLQDENMSLNSKLSEDDVSSVSERTTVDGRPQTDDKQENLLPSIPSDDVIDVVTSANDPDSRLDEKNDNSAENLTTSSVEITKELEKESKKKKDKDKDQGKQSRKNSTGAKHLHVPHGSVCGSSSTGSLWRKKKKKRQENYEVTVYKKEANGDLTPEQRQVSTKVDIYEYFKVPQRRERLTRQKLLEDVRKKEQQQREKVSSFLKKIDEEDNQQPVIVVERQDDDSGGGLLMRQSKRLLAPTPRDALTSQMNEMEKIRTQCRYVRIYHRSSELQDWQRRGPRLTSWAPNAKDALL